MSDYDFLKLVRFGKLDDTKEYLDSHDINHVLHQIILNNSFYTNTLNYIMNYYSDQKISPMNAKALIEKNKLSITELPIYMYKDEEYESILFLNKYYNVIENKKIIDICINNNCLTENKISYIIKSNEIDDNYNEELYTNVEYTKVLSNLNYRNGYYFKKEGINNEIIDLLFERGMEYSSALRYQNCDLYKDFYFITKELEKARKFDSLDYVAKNLSSYSEEELYKIINLTVNKTTNDSFFEIINSNIKYINYWLNNTDGNKSNYINRISNEYLYDESNGIVKKFIDLGLYFSPDLDINIRSNETYVKYYLDRCIKNKENFAWITKIGNNLLNNPSNGIIYKALENGCNLFDEFYNYSEYLNKYMELNNFSTSCYSKIPKKIVNDPTNKVVLNLMKQNLYFFYMNEELYNIKEYLIYYIENSDSYLTLKRIVDKCDINLIIDNNLFGKCIEQGYIISNTTSNEILNNEDYIYYYVDFHMSNDGQSYVRDLFHLLSDDMIYNVSNGIVLNAIRKGYSYVSSYEDKRLLNRREYVLEFFVYQSSSSNNNLINLLPKDLLDDREVVYQCLENGYRYSKDTPEGLYQVDYIKKFISFYPNISWTDINTIFDKLDESIIEDESNGLVYCAIDYGYDINAYTPSCIFNHPNYLIRYCKYKLKNSTLIFDYIRKYNPDLLSDEKFVCSIIDNGYRLVSNSPVEMLSNYNCVMYALMNGKVSRDVKVPIEIIDEKMAIMLVINRVDTSNISFDFYKQHNLSDLYKAAINYLYNIEEDKLSLLYLKHNKDNLIIDDIPKEYLNNKTDIMYFIFFKPNIIDIVDKSLLDDLIVRSSFINGYKINNRERLTDYINILGIDDTIKIMPNIIEYYTEEEFNNLFNQDYENILRHAIDNGYNMKKCITNLPSTLNNKKFTILAIENNIMDIVNYIDYEMDIEVFNLLWDRKIVIPLLSNKIKNQIVNNPDLLDVILKSNSKKLVSSISIFYPDNVDSKNFDILLDKVLIGYKVSNRDKFKYNLGYIYSKNKEVFFNLNLNILSDKYEFLGVETINRIIPDEILLSNVLKLTENKLKIFNICVNYLQSIEIDTNINDVLYKLVKKLNGSDFSKMSNDIINNFNNLDGLITYLKNGRNNKNNISYLDNLINILCLSDNMYKIESMKDVSLFEKKKKEYYDNFKFRNYEQLSTSNGYICYAMKYGSVKERILNKYYNIDFHTFTFIYNRYCYLKKEIDNLEDIKLRKILHDIVFLYECADLDALLEIYNNISIEPVNLKYSVLLEGTIRNEYVKKFNNKLSTNKLSNIEDNIYEVEDNVNLLVHVLGAYNNKYTEPSNFKDEWNIELMKNHGVCTSYITNQNLATARSIKYPTLVFNELENNSILLSSPDDIASNSMNEEFATSLMKPCCFLSPDTMIDETRYHHNEIVLERKYLDDKKNINYKRLPNYVLFMAKKEFINEDDTLNMDKIKSTDLWRMTEKAAKDFNIPILIINKVKINKNEIDEINKLKDEMLSTENYLLLNKILVRMINNLMDPDNIMTSDDLDNFVNSMIKLSDTSEKGNEILETIMYTIMEENRKFKDHRAEAEYNFINKFETIVYDKIKEYNKVVEEDKKIHI